MSTAKSKKKSVKRKAYGGIAFIPSISTMRYPHYDDPYKKYFEDLDPHHPILFHNTSIMPKKTQADERKEVIRTVRRSGSEYYRRDNKSVIRPKEIPKHRVHIVPMPEKTRFRAWDKSLKKAYKTTNDIRNRIINSEELIPIDRRILDGTSRRYEDAIFFKEMERYAIRTRARKRKEHGSLRHYVPRR